MSKVHYSSNSNKRICGLCKRSIETGERTNQHHPIYKSAGGTATVEVHETCHRNYHNTPGADGLSDFQWWGKLSAMDGHWAFTLKGVKDNPLYEPVRAFHRMFYQR